MARNWLGVSSVVAGLVTDNWLDQSHSGRFIDASRYIHGVTRVNHSHRGHEKQGS